MPRTLLLILVLTAPVLAAPVPAEEKPKPRAKLLGTITLDAEVTSAFWLADGKLFALGTRDRIVVYPRESLGGESKPLVTLGRPDGGRGEIGPTPAGGLYVLAPSGDRLNAENTLHVWSAKSLLAGGESKPDRTVTLEADNPRGLVISANGDSLFAMVVARGPKVKGSPVRFVRLSAKTGDLQKAVPLSDLSEDQYFGHTFDPRTGRLYLATLSAASDSATIQCREPDGGKQLWSTVLPGQPNPQGTYNSAALAVSENGERLVIHHSARVVREVPRPQPGARPEFNAGRAITVLDTAKGEVFTDASYEPTLEQRTTTPCMSSDGRLLFTIAGGRVAVTDAKKGGEVKGWERFGAGILATFQPGGYELLITEHEVSVPPRNPAGPTAVDGRRESKAIVGVWDFSPVVK